MARAIKGILLEANTGRAKLFHSTRNQIRVVETLPLQVRHNRILPRYFNPIEDPISGYGKGYHWVKPGKGGMWTSSYIPNPEPSEYGDKRPLANICDWIRWCNSEGFMMYRWRYAYIYEVVRPVRIVEIDTHDDLLALNDEYGVIEEVSQICHDKDPSHPLSRFPDWTRIARDFDAVHLTERGQWATRMPHLPIPFGSDNLYGWDCESTLWLRFPWKILRFVKKINLSLGYPRMTRKQYREQRQISMYGMRQATKRMEAEMASRIVRRLTDGQDPVDQA